MATRGWKVKPGLGRNRRKAPRLGSLETWRSDLIVESSTTKSWKTTEDRRPSHLSPRGPGLAGLSVSAPVSSTELSVVGLKATASSPVFSQLPGANLTKVSRGSHKGLSSPIPSPPSLSRVSSIDAHIRMCAMIPSPRMLPQQRDPSPRKNTKQPQRASQAKMAEKQQPAQATAPQKQQQQPVEPPIVEPTKQLLAAPTISRDVLGGKLMEADALLRHKFATRSELCKVQSAVEAALALLAELPALAKQANVIEGALFQDLLQRLATKSEASGVGTAAPNAAPQKAMPPTPTHGPRGLLVSRTPIPGAEREHWQSSQSVEELFGGDQNKLAALMKRVAGLRGLLRIKIEDNRDLDLARRALGDVKCAIDNLWWYAEAQGVAVREEDGEIAPREVLGVTTLLQELRCQ